MSKVELTNMCMIYDQTNNKVLVQNRSKSWKGISFPGGHVEDGESIIEATIREIKEETGLTISGLEPCGLIHWHHDQTKEKYLVFNFRTDQFSGELIHKTDEGEVFWVDVDKLPHLNCASGFLDRLPMFLEKKYTECFGIWNEKAGQNLKWFLKSTNVGFFI
jgi:8-oxo-dGTP diphosphatase